MQSEIDLFFEEIKRSYSSNYPFVVYRKPDEALISAYFQNSSQVFEQKSFDETGFLFAPFNETDRRIIFPADKCRIVSIALKDEHEFQLDESNSFVEGSNKKEEINHIELVQRAIDFIKDKRAEKIVVSRKETFNYPNFDIINSLKRMLTAYRNSFVYLWFHPDIGLWMGATPERFINVGQGKFKTMALAGTQLYKGSTTVDWHDKELHEQQLVTDFIVDKIKGHIEEVKIVGPYSVRAGNLLHLRTDISGTCKDKRLVKSLIRSLYPTPAICGLPKRIAANFILKEEGYNRAFYSGFLGELNVNGSTNLFVNLRCMQFENKICSIYVGGGITRDSDPYKEWEETVSKSKVIKKVL